MGILKTYLYSINMYEVLTKIQMTQKQQKLHKQKHTMVCICGSIHTLLILKKSTNTANFKKNC